MLAGLIVIAPVSSATDTVHESTKLVASDGQAHDWYGFSVAVDGNTTIVGAPETDDGNGVETGAAYVYVRSSGSWTRQAKLFASDGANGDDFGVSVAIDGDTALVGARFADTASDDLAGSTYVFTRDSSGSWTEQAKLVASDGATGDRFGLSVSLDGDTALVGAKNADNATGTETGAAYIYTRSGTSWTQQTKLTPSDGATGDRFGLSVGLDGDTTLVGAKNADNATGTETGAAYIYTRSGTSWTQQTKLTPSDGANGDDFGVSVDLGQGLALVGAENADNANGLSAGSAYLFAEGSSGSWTEQAKLTASDGGPFDRFGSAVSLDGDNVLVGSTFADNATGASVGAAYEYVHNGTAWNEHLKLAASDGGAGDRFGSAVSLAGDLALVGAFDDDNANGENAGSVYAFVPPSPENLRATAGAQAAVIELDWDEPSGTSRSFTYHVKRATSSGGPYTEIDTTTERTYTDAGLGDQTYYYVVTAEAESGRESDPSNEDHAHPRPEAPQGLTAEESESSGAIDLDWTHPLAGSSPLVYRVYRSTTSGDPYALVDETTQTSYTDEDLDPGTYHYVVTAVDAHGVESPQSAEASAEPAERGLTTLPSIPEPANATQNDAGTGGDASDDPADPTILAGGELIHINGSLLPGLDDVDAYGTRISPSATNGMRFVFEAQPGMALELELVRPDDTVAAQDQAPLQGGLATVQAQAPPGEHLQAGIWTIVLELGDTGAKSLHETQVASNATANLTPNMTTPPLGFNYQDERECDPKC